MNRKQNLYIVCFVTVVVGVVVACLHRIPQSQAYHEFCDQRAFWGIPNAANVVSNVVFLIAGVAGLLQVRRAGRLRVIYVFLFAGMVLTCAGSAYYHYSPDDAKLVYDRLPMTIVFMSLMAAVIAEGIGPRSGLAALAPLLALGVGSVWWWEFGGDLRLYVFVQYYPLVGIPLILLLFPGAAVRRGWRPLLLAFVWYGVAKVAEAMDGSIFSATGFMSGHTLKHLAAGWSTWLLVERFKLMYGDLCARGV